MKLNGNLLTPTDPNNYLVDWRSEYVQDGNTYYSTIIKGISLEPRELVDDAYKAHYDEVTPAWKEEHEPKPEPEEETK